MLYFIHEPIDDTTIFFKTSEQFLDAIAEFDFLGKYCDDGWSSEVENVIAGAIPDGVVRCSDEKSQKWQDEYDFLAAHATHIATATNERSRPDEDDINEDGIGPDGTYWGEYEYICSYHFADIPK